jgi:hypothetical protein
MSGGYNPNVMNPYSIDTRVNTKSGGFQTPFFFGGSQVPNDLILSKAEYNGSSGEGIRGSYNHKLPHTFDMVFNKKHSLGNGFHMGSISKTHLGDLDFTTKRGDKVFHRKGHNIKLPHSLPFMNKA